MGWVFTITMVLFPVGWSATIQSWKKYSHPALAPLVELCDGGGLAMLWYAM